MSKNSKKAFINDTNKNSRIVSRIDRKGKSRTETQRRDIDSDLIAVSTDPRTNSTFLFIDTNEYGTVRFNGRTARSLYRLLRKHYRFTGKSNKA